MPICVPIRDMKGTAAFAEPVHTAQAPAIATKNGRKPLLPCLPKYMKACAPKLQGHSFTTSSTKAFRHRVRMLKGRQDAHR